MRCWFFFCLQSNILIVLNRMIRSWDTPSRLTNLLDCESEQRRNKQFNGVPKAGIVKLPLEDEQVEESVELSVE